MSRIEKKRRNNLFDILSWNLQGLRNFQIIYRRKKEGCQRLFKKKAQPFFGYAFFLKI